ncbi:MAG TPA: TonB-dependent receptor [Kofleriaceae bacterium]|nr:TonB-dependent receptor [Kofleriaceae bacterium]
MVLTTAWGRHARAEDPSPEPSATANAELSDDELRRMADAESIEIYDERPDKPFDRDTEVRLTGEQLAQRGATDLATALALLPDVTVREAGRGGLNVDIRGARKGSVTVLIDGVAVSDPYYGTFDVSTIPITDIVQIRVSTTPQSPIDGPGGPGGVIEVHTRDAIGSQVVVARLTGDSLPSFGMSGTARAALAKHLALRIAATGLAGARDLEAPMAAGSVGEARRAGTGSARLEYRKADRRIVVDGFLDDRHYISPPGDTGSILMIDRETTSRVSAKADDKLGKLQLQAQTWAHFLERRSRYFTDATLTKQLQTEQLSATRIGGMALATQAFAKDFRWATSATVDHEAAHVDTLTNGATDGDVTLLELAGDVQYERSRVRVDLAGGVAVPSGVGADPWPEAKLVTKLRASTDVELTATAGYKGRVPTLRERFDTMTGNPALGPELARHAELRAVWQGLRSAALGTPDQPAPRVRIELAPFARKTTGSSRVSLDTGKLANLDDVFLYGIDAQARVRVHRTVELGGAYDFIRACQLDSARGCDVSEAEMGGADPLDRLPHHRYDAWLQVTPTARIAALARVKYFGESIDRAKTVPGYALVEANVSAQLGREYLAVLRVDDATDVRPEIRAGFHAPGRVISVVLQGTWQ